MSDTSNAIASQDDTTRRLDVVWNAEAPVPQTTRTGVAHDSRRRDQASQAALSLDLTPMPCHGLLIFLLGAVALISLAFMLTDLLARKGVRPVTATIFVWSSLYCAFVDKKRRAMATRTGAGGARIDGVRSTPRGGLSAEARSALLTYFTHGSAEENAHNAWNKALEVHKAELANSRHRPASVRGSLADTTPASSAQSTPATTPGPPSPAQAPGASSACAPDAAVMVGLGGCEVLRSDNGGDDRDGGGSSVSGMSMVRQDTLPRPPGVVLVAPGDRVRSTTSDTGSASEAQGAEGGLTRSDSKSWTTPDLCIICFSEYDFGNRLCRLPCRHVYHSGCIESWLERSRAPCCPICKLDLARAYADFAAANMDAPLAEEARDSLGSLPI